MHTPLKRIALFLTNQFQADQDRWVLWVPVFLGAGIGLYFSLPFEPPVLLTMSITVLALVFTGIFWYQRLSRRLFLSALTLVILGVAVSQGRTQQISSRPAIDRPFFTDVIGRLKTLEKRPRNAVLTLENCSDSNAHPLGRVRLYVVGSLRPSQELAPGDWVRVRSRVVPLHGQILPESYDFRQRLYFEEITALAYGCEQPVPLAHSEARTFKQKLSRLRLKLDDTLRQKIPGEAGAIASALVTGDRSGITEHLRQSFADAGLAHILAISGLHLSLFTAMTFFLCSQLFSVFRRLSFLVVQKISASASILITLGYLGVCGAPIPALRAFIMTTLTMGCLIFDRRPFSLFNVMVAGTLILLFMPEVLLTPSFQLSFAAVVALISAFERWEAPLKAQFQTDQWTRKLAFYFLGVVGTTLIASLATLPYSVHTFHRFTTYGIAANLIVVPMVSLWIMPAILLTGALALLGLEDVGLSLLRIGIEVMITIATTVSQWPGTVCSIGATPGWMIGMVTFGGLWVCLWKSRWRWMGGGVIALALLPLPFLSSPDLIISEEGLVAFSGTQNTLWLNASPYRGYVRDTLLKSMGLTKARAIPHNGFISLDGLMCEEGVCTLKRRGHKFLFALDHEASKRIEALSACPTLLASTLSYRGPCHDKSIVIDRGAIRAYGAHTVTVPNGDDKPLSIKTAHTGQRPWNKKPENKRS